MRILRKSLIHIDLLEIVAGVSNEKEHVAFSVCLADMK